METLTQKGALCCVRALPGRGVLGKDLLLQILASRRRGPRGSLLGELRGLQESRQVEGWAGLQSWTRCGAVYNEQKGSGRLAAPRHSKESSAGGAGTGVVLA